MTRHLAVTVLAATALLGGCAAAEDVASDAASAATSQAKESAVRELRGTVCPLVVDRDLSESDRATLGSAVDLAQGLGVESELLTAAEDIAASDGTPPESALARMAEECR